MWLWLPWRCIAQRSGVGPICADLSTLVAAVVARDLVDALTSPGPFAVFVPTNDGFAGLHSGHSPEPREQGHIGGHPHLLCLWIRSVVHGSEVLPG